ncbi:MAG: thioredoxin domain-containing protein [Planctomycetes bacterium]|nr:thioredoxin domain-containing protein [Planctomycetota bacterium]
MKLTLTLMVIAITCCPLSAAEKGEKPLYTNSLIHSKSPYLKQHAHNPINWYEWTDNTFKKAKEENKLIFLSVGYATCHWCHVMEEECFKDDEIAAYLNKYFISIKVDREERPDIDEVYMKLARALGSGNGWPLTVVMTPDKTPVFAGSYIPKYDKHNITGLMTQLPLLNRQFLYRSSIQLETKTRMKQRIERMNAPGRSAPEVQPSTEHIERIKQGIMSSYSPRYGGFGRAPKFPRSHKMIFLLNALDEHDRNEILDAVKHTIRSIRKGGIYDQVGFGIHRYSTDHLWFLPHFEKMLYNQALFSLSLSEYYRISKDPISKVMYEEINSYVQRDLSHPDGAFYSAEDADSEGEEGVFYVWKTDELKDSLNSKEYKLLNDIFLLADEGNWKDQASGQEMPSNVLTLSEKGLKLIEQDSKDVNELLLKIRKAREKRPRPLLDDKILSDWNGLMIANLAKSATSLNNPVYQQQAIKAYGFIRKHMLKEDYTLMHRYSQGDVAIEGFLADYANMSWAALELYQSTQDLSYLKDAIGMKEQLMKLFWDNKGSFFYMTASHQNGDLPIRPVTFADNALPSGNAVALFVLNWLSHILGDHDTSKICKRLSGTLCRGLYYASDRYAMTGYALQKLLNPPTECVVVQPKSAKYSELKIQELQNKLPPNSIIIVKNTDNQKELERIVSRLNSHKCLNNKATYYLCHNLSCFAPTNNLDEALRKID